MTTSEESVQIGATTAEQPLETSTGARARSFLDYLKTILVTLAVALFLKSFVVEAFRIPSSSMEETLLVGDFLLVNKLAYGIRTPRYIPLTNMAIPTVHIPAFSRVNRGDVVVFEFPGSIDQGNPDEPVNYIKRCIGLPGDLVEIQEGQVYVNGKPLGLPTHARRNGSNGAAFHHRSRLFPFGAGYTEHDYGPLTVPRKNDRLQLTPDNVAMWRSLILREGHTIAYDEQSGILIDGTLAQEYIVQQDYYFVMGDNRDNSLDSR
ncbi:MAG: signal peptidase I, partial [Bacteroidota bacterium]